MPQELIEVLSNPNAYECCCHDGEVYLRRCAKAEAKSEQEARSLEPA
jgi:hypothetical protein